MAQTLKNLPAMQETQVRSLGQEDPLEDRMTNPLQYSCLNNPMDRGPHTYDYLYHISPSHEKVSPAALIFARNLEQLFIWG